MKLFVYSFRSFDEKEIFDKLQENYSFEYGYTSEYPSVENAYLASGYDAVSFTPCTCDKNLIDAFHSVGVKYIAARSIGFNHIDIDYAHSLGMGVCHVEYAPDTVADYTVMMMLMGCRKAAHIFKRAELQDYSLKGKLGKDLCDCTVGIIGTGKIGSTVIKRLNAFGCKILAYDMYKNDDITDICTYVELDVLLKESDIISLHCLVTEATTHLLDKNAFNKMKKDVMIINTARGLLIDTDALISAISDGKVGFAGLDVLENEDGLYYYNRIGDCITNYQMAILRSFPNVLLMPHTAFYTEKVVYSMAQNVVKGVIDMIEGNPNPLINKQKEYT